jgi:hypothetical protein
MFYISILNFSNNFEQDNSANVMNCLMKKNVVVVVVVE